MHGLPGEEPEREVWSEAPERLREADPKLAEAIQQVGSTPRVQIVEDPFEAIARAIIQQQIGAPAATKIAQELAEKFDGEFPSAGEILELGVEELSDLGLPRARAEALWNLSRKVSTQEIDLNEIAEAEQDEVIEELTRLDGIGPWTAKMFLVFSLARPDVLLAGDVGLLNAVKNVYDMDERPTEEELREMAEAWRPFRSAACWYLWKADGGFTPGL